MNRVIIFVWIWMFVLSVARCSDNDTPDDDQPEEKPPVAEGHYRNPITVENELAIIGEGGTADPSVFRWMGKYYLMTTQFYNYKEVGFKVWESTDLVNWNYTRAVPMSGFAWDVLWSPEMYYYRGVFYIYFSGPGGKMAAMKYAPPVGDVNPEPFSADANWEVFTHDYLQLSDHSIDGSILIEPNGDKFAFFSGLYGVKYRKVNSMEDGNGGSVTQLRQCSVENIVINPGEVGTVGWTEAPTAFKKDGVYYLTYTGNHFLRPDYQIHLATGSSLQNLTPIADNPWISRVWGDWTATGNCYPVLGPNLKDYYYTYHVKEGYRISPADQQLLRKLMVDKVEFKSDYIETNAPTFDDEPIPDSGDFEDDFSSGLNNFDVVGDVTWTPWGGFAVRAEALGVTTLDNAIFSKETTGADFVAESNVRIVEHQATGVSGVVFIQGDDISSINIAIGVGIVDGNSKIITFDVSNDWQFFDLPDEFNSADWTDVRVEKRGNSVKLFVNNVDVMTLDVDSFSNGKIGYMCYDCNADVAWTAFSNY